ncbi:MAG: hypothetical protein AAGA03_14420, partial [Planctomycetota bacterium]
MKRTDIARIAEAIGNQAWRNSQRVSAPQLGNASRVDLCVERGGEFGIRDEFHANRTQRSG